MSLSVSTECPSVYLTHSLLTHSLTHTMEVLQDGEELVFLYQLVEGKTDTSYACHIAAMMGLAPELVQRGAKVQTCIKNIMILY